MYVVKHKCTCAGTGLVQGRVCTRDWYMGNLRKVGVPTDLKGLQSLLGKFMYASAYMPHYKQRVHAIEKLLACKGEVH